MSEPTQATPSAATSPAPGSTGSKKPKRKRTWRQRLIRTLVVVIVLGLILRLATFYALAPVLRKVGAGYGVDITFDRRDFTFIAGDVGLWGLKIAPLGGGEPFFKCGYLRGYLSVTDLIRGKIRVLRAEADGVDLVIERTKDGKLPMLPPLLAAAASPPGAPPAAAPQKPASLDFTPPLMIENVRLSHARAIIRDAYVSPPLEATVATDIRINDVGAQGRPTRFDIDVWSDPVLDSLRISGEASGDGRNLRANARLTMRGFHPKPLAGYLEPLGIRPIGSSLDSEFRFALQLQSLPDPSRAATGSMTIDNVKLICDEQPVAGLSKIQVDLAELDPTAATISMVLVEGGSAHATRGRNGAIQVAGIEFADATTQPASPAIVAPATPPLRPSQSPATRPAPPFRLNVAEVALRDMTASLRDFAVAPVNELSVVLKELTARSDATASSDPAQTSVAIDGTIALPGVIQAITLKGSAKPFMPEKSVQLAFGANGVRPDALKPYLSAIGIDSLLQSGTFQGQLSAVVHPAPTASADVHLSNVRFVDTSGELVALDRVDVTGMGNEAGTGRLKVASVELSGPSLNVTREADGRIVAGGLRFGGPIASSSGTASPASTSSPAPAPAPAQVSESSVAALPRVEIGHFAWKGMKLNLRDEQVQPASEFAVKEVGIEAKDIVFDLTSDQNSKDGTVRAWLDAPQLAEKLGFDGKLRSGRGAFAADLAVRGSGMKTSVLAAYLKPLGIEPTLHDGAIQADVKVSVAEQTGQSIGASVDVSNVQLSEAGVELAGVDAIQIRNAAIGSSGVDVESIRIAHPRAQVARDADGSIEAMGVRLLPAGASTRPFTAAAAPVVAASPVTPTTASDETPSPTASLGSVKIEDAQIGWTDHATAKPVHTVAHAEVALSALVVGKAAPPAKFHTTVSVDGSLGEMNVVGELSPSADAPSLHATIDARGVRAGTLAAYFPPGTELSTTAGRFQASIDAGISSNPAGGNAARLVVEKIDWRDADSPEPLLSIDSIKAIASRIDPSGDVIAIDEVSLAGLETGAQLSADGSASALGLTFRPAAPDAPATQPAAAPAPTTVPAVVVSSDAPPEDVARRVTESRRPLPVITLGKLDVNVRRATVRNLADTSSVPITLEDLRLRNVTPIEMGGPDADSRPPVQLELTGKLTPLFGNLALNASLTPLAAEPAGTITLNVTGVRGQGITEFMPALRQQLDGSQLTDGRFHTEVQVHTKFDRRGPRDFGLSKGFSLELAVNDIAFTQGDARLFGLESIRADQIRVAPQTGSVIAKALDITKPQVFAYREADGIHALGLVILTPAPAAQPTTEPSPAPVAVTEPPETPPPATTPSSGEIRIDRLTVSGIDVRFEDRSVTPLLIVPLNNLDLEVRGLTTLALSEPKVIRFAALLNAAKVPLSVHQKGGGVVGTVIDIASRVSGSSEGSSPATRPMEDRELFSQIAVAGQMSIYPRPLGYAKTSINGVELAAFEGVAKQAGVNLSEGVFDGTVDLRFRDDGSLDTKSKLVITDLSVSEGPNGWLSKNLALPAPLDAVIKALRDADGSITVPLSPTLKEGNISGSALAAEAVSALGAMITTAIANAPLKIVGGVGDVIGLGGLSGGGKDKANEQQPIVIQFAPGGTDLDATARNQLSDLLERARRDNQMQLTIRHELGGADVTIAAQRAHPSRDDCMAMAAQLRSRKLALAEERSRLASEASAQLASLGAKQSEPTIARLRGMDRQIADVELSLDQLYELLKPGAERQALRRTRAGCLEIGRARSDAVARALQSADLPDAAQRIRTAGVQFNPTDSNDGGRIVITPIIKKKS